MLLSLDEKIGQLFMVGFPGLEPPDYILEWLHTGRIGGVYLFSRNVDNPAQLARLTAACHKAATKPILIGIDQEGGTVARLRAGFTESPGAMALSAAGSETLAERMAGVLGKEMRALGINWDFAPVVDTAHDINNPSVGTRSLGTDRQQIARLAIAQVRGFQNAGVAACAKHFPGLGNTPVDTHLALAVIHNSLDDLWDNDLVPFRSVVQQGVATVMTTHVKFDNLDADHPSTLSPVIVQDLLRQKIGFEGVVATDCMEMKAITNHYGAGESAVLAAMAGVDLVMFSHTRSYQEEAYEAVLEAVRTGRLAMSRIDESVARIQRLKEQYAVDYENLSVEIIRHPDHQHVALEAARAGLVMLRSEPGVLQLVTGSGSVALVEFASYMDSEVMEQGGQTALVTLVQQEVPEIAAVSLKADLPEAGQLKRAYSLAEISDVLILATRSAHLNPNQLAIAQDIIDRSRSTILLCLRNPYDVDVLKGVGTVICTCGDSTPSLQAAVDVLLGRYKPSGKLPVQVELQL